MISREAFSGLTARRGLAERPNALVLKTSVVQPTGGSNPPASATLQPSRMGVGISTAERGCPFFRA